ncbi:MAG: 16S rRNA (guanine(966)-N(2))-methyltransferase RsmD [Acidobacteriia bacterium]|nr:16S rRNA (guanine(966)-N(2))-methyltransferase RsmD [Terriglobia bacterium]
MLRIISGEYRGRRIQTLAGHRLRPSSDQFRETLFNMLSAVIRGSHFVDAYAGSGAVGIEAVSRGARHVSFIENHKPAVNCIRSNLLALEIKSGFSIIPLDVVRALPQLEPFDIFFLDPPYAEAEEYEKILTALGSTIQAAQPALVLAEHSRRLILRDAYGGLRRFRKKIQGDSQLSFFQPSAGDADH